MHVCLCTCQNLVPLLSTCSVWALSWMDICQCCLNAVMESKYIIEWFLSLQFFDKTLRPFSFLCGVYVLGKPTNISNGWLRYTQMILLGLLGLWSNLCSWQTLNFHAMTERHWQWCAQMWARVIELETTLAAATIPGWHLFCSELLIVWLLFEVKDYSRAVSNRGICGSISCPHRPKMHFCCVYMSLYVANWISTSEYHECDTTDNFQT